MKVEVDIRKCLGAFRLDVAFSLEQEVIALCGASGAGKSLTLKCIAGIETPDEGYVVIGDKVAFDAQKKINLSPQERNVGLLFQDYALFPHMTVFQNLDLVNRHGQDIAEYLERFQLKGMEMLYPYQLSGGQKQRAAMARMLITKPDIIMLDEPFAALDSKLKRELKKEVKQIIETLGIPTILVSHDEEEVEYFTQRVVHI